MRAICNHNVVACIVLAFWAAGCQKTVTLNNIISIHATSTQVLADGSSMDTIYADLPVDALAAYRQVTFQSSSGLFANGLDTMSVFANRTDLDPGKITAVVTWHSSLRSGPDTLSASTNTVPQSTNYLILDLAPSMADSIMIMPSSYTLKDTFGMQLIIGGILYNNQGGMVSLGTEVQFSDQSAGGVFMPTIANVDSTSRVSVIYFPPLLPSGSTTGVYITIQAVVLNSSIGQTMPKSTTEIYISP